MAAKGSRVACRVCSRVHEPPRCPPLIERSSNMTLTLPRHLMHALRDRVPWGERSAWIAGLIESELEREPT